MKGLHGIRDRLWPRARTPGGRYLRWVKRGEVWTAAGAGDYAGRPRALVWNGMDLRVTDRPEPQADPETAIVRVTLAGICNTDLEIVKGYMGFRGVLGHEFVGTVADGPPRWRGKRVVGEINFACGECAACQRGLGRHCGRRRVMGILNADGAFAELLAVPAANLHELPDSVRDEDAVFTEPLAAAFEILEQTPVQPGTRAVVLGDGKLGLLVAQVLAQAGARVLAVGRHAAKLAILERCGIETVVLDRWRPEPADLVVEATGSAAGTGPPDPSETVQPGCRARP